MAVKNSAAKLILRFFSWLMIIIGGPTFVICTLCAVFALAGLLEIYTFGERIVYFLVFLLVAVLFFAVLYCGLKLKKHLTGRTNTVKHPQKQENVSPAVQKDVAEAAPAPQSANPPVSEKTAETAEPEAKVRTREERLADFSETVSVQAAWDTFSPEEQNRFSNMVYQYSQDVGRGGYAPREHYAELRGLEFVGSWPVPKEVARRLEEMQKAKEAAKEKPAENKSAESPVQSTPAPGRPADKIEVIRLLSTTEDKDDSAFSFEKTLVKREVVKAGGRYYIRATDYQCASGTNGRPIYTLFEDYYECKLTNEEQIQRLITEDKEMDFAFKMPAYRYKEGGTGVLF